MKVRESLSVQSYDLGVSLGWRGTLLREADLKLPVWIPFDACLPDRFPVGGERLVAGVFPIMEDLVDDLWDELASRVGGCRVVGNGNLFLGQTGSRVWHEYADEEP